MSAKLNPKQDETDDDHSEVINGAFLIASGDPAMLLQAVDQALNPVALTVGRTIEARVAALVRFGLRKQ